MDPLSSSRTQPLIDRNEIEMQPPTSTNAAASTSATAAITSGDPQVLHDLKTKMTELFRGDRTDTNGEAMDALVEGRANRLHELNYSSADVDRLLDKAERMDRVTVPTQGAVGGLPFGVVTVVLDKVPGVTADATGNPGYTGFIAGAMSGAADVVGGGVLAKTTEDSLWLKAPADKLETIMADSQKAKSEAHPIKQAGQSALALQTFSVRNVVRLGAAAALNATAGPKVAAAFDTAIGSAGGMVAGAGYAVLMHNNQKAAGLVGGAQLFGRKDWEDQFKELDKCSPSRPYINGAKRAAKFPLDVATETLSSVRKVFEGGNLLTNGGALAGGFALTGMARNAAKQAALNQGLPKGAVAAADHAVNVAGSALTFAAYGAAGVLAGKAADKGVKVIQEDIPPKALKLAKKVQDGIEEGAKDTGEFVENNYNSAKKGFQEAGTAIKGAYTSGTQALGLRERRVPTGDGTDQV
ncbi:hypothetical protein [Pseudomonas sp. 10S4]|uniref:hypothetical protein n=1 Tax=Pseudomonas sp. 10S4 TaxID=3048583 RepID=UPI002AC91AD2|nr:MULTISPECIES: hypothetical protein [unclassified Pseudomonas]MEB0223840.1 hypothetical protein [Pseudomonas sp. 5S1]MEB0292782.1 hypothetical protein [Pseudomonas sp. 10S4]WPX16302.1 hypothetical protein RHM58_19890 [Pseudomonas sp. 10S4]